MNINDLKPLGSLDQNKGVKAVLYGLNGTAKTPMCAHINNSIFLSIESGLRSVRNVTDTPGFKATTAKDIREFFAWYFTHKDALRFDTLVVDSLTKLAEIILKEAQSKNSHGLKAYGVMLDDVLGIIRNLVEHPKNVILIAQVAIQERTVQQGFQTTTINYQYPLLPGRSLDKYAFQEIDEIWYAHRTDVPGVGNTIAILTQGNEGVMARSRDSRLNTLEPPDMNALLAKINS